MGISQNSKKDTAAFTRKYKISFPILLDDTNSYPVSNSYGLHECPHYILDRAGRQIEISSVGWIPKDMEAFNQRAAEASAGGAKPLFRPDEQIADFRAG